MAIWREGLAFPTWADDAIPAHVGRLLAYAIPDDQANESQRALIHKALSYRPLPTAYRGAAPTLAGLAGRWAVPGTEYPARLAAIANTIIGAPPMRQLDQLDILDMTDQIAQIPLMRGHETLAAREHEQWITFHYSAVIYHDRSRAAELARVLSEARYQIGKNWGKPGRPPVYGDGLMYDFVILSDGQIVRTRKRRQQLWHVNNRTGNGQSWSLHWMLGPGQDLTPEQRRSSYALADALRADGGIPRDHVVAHCEWPLSSAGRAAPAARPAPVYTRQFGQSTCPGPLLFPYVAAYRVLP